MWRDHETDWLTKNVIVIKQLPKEVLYDFLCDYA